MDINKTLFEKLEKLAMLNFPNEKIPDITKNLEDILGFVENISQIQTTEDSCMNADCKTPLREDKVELVTSIPESTLKTAPNSQDGYFIVPKIIE